jgi:lambda family phage minor tail protein L
MPSPQHLELAQHLATDGVAQLFKLDPSPLNLGLPNYYFTPGTLNGAAIVYQGITYTPFPITVTGFEYTTQGTQPRPKLSVSNIGGLFTGLVISANDLVGAKLTRLRTFTRFLDNGSTPDPDAHWPSETYIVDRKSAHTKTTIEWELATPLDNKNLKIPGRLALKNSCFQRYRRWDGTEFDYSKATCPYTGTAYFNVVGASVILPQNDQCGKRLSDCRNRFGQGATLPFAGFPAMQRI